VKKLRGWVTPNASLEQPAMNSSPLTHWSKLTEQQQLQPNAAKRRVRSMLALISLADQTKLQRPEPRNPANLSEPAPPGSPHERNSPDEKRSAPLLALILPDAAQLKAKRARWNDARVQRKQPLTALPAMTQVTGGWTKS
jgi:hypothetical protein